MRIAKKILLIIFVVSFQLSSIEKKRLILHVDVNRTIIAMDVAQGKNLEETINGILSELIYAKWDGKKEQSYYDYTTDLMCEKYPHFSRASEELKKIRDRELKTLTNTLKEKFPDMLLKYELEKSTMLKILSAQEMVVYPSFFKLIEWLESSNYEYSIHLRTFGSDLPKVVPIIESSSKLRFDDQAKFKSESLIFKNGILKSCELYSLFTQSSLKNYAIQDDYFYWKSKKFQQEGGKLFPIDLDDHKILSIFFDDNADDPERPIIHAINPNGDLLDTKNLLKSGNIVAVDRKEAILDENYFIDILKLKLDN